MHVLNEYITYKFIKPEYGESHSIYLVAVQVLDIKFETVKGVD